MEELGGPQFTLVVPNEFVSLAELCLSLGFLMPHVNRVSASRIECVSILSVFLVTSGVPSREEA